MENENYFQPWTSDLEPKVPGDWGLDVGRNPHVGDCKGCGEAITNRHQYLYQFTKAGVLLLHNRETCWNKYNEDQIKWEHEQENQRDRSE